jgi:hypothetical protein
MNSNLMAAHFFCAAYMTGIIWFVQLVHYPMLHLSDGADASAGHAEYTRRMGFVVMPVMLAELALQLLWIQRSPTPIAWTAASLLLLIWLSTFMLQVPCHTRLQKHFDPTLQQKLVHTNWIRTIAWTARALLLGLALLPRI